MVGVKHDVEMKIGGIKQRGKRVNSKAAYRGKKFFLIFKKSPHN